MNSIIIHCKNFEKHMIAITPRTSNLQQKSHLLQNNLHTGDFAINIELSILKLLPHTAITICTKRVYIFIGDICR